MIRFPNPFAGVSEIVAKAFAVIADRDGVAGHKSFHVVPPRNEARHPKSSLNAPTGSAVPNKDPNGDAVTSGRS